MEPPRTACGGGRGTIRGISWPREAASHFQRLQEVLKERDMSLEPQTVSLYKELMTS